MTTPRTTLRTTPAPFASLAAATAAAALLGGCVPQQADPDPGGADASPSTADADPSPSPTPTEPAEPSAPALPEAADGTDLDACADAECEVLVETGDEFALDGAHGLDRFVVEEIGEEGLRISGHSPGGFVSGTIAAPDGEQTTTFVMNGLTVTLVAVDGSAGIIALTP